jgi:ABC-type uncharacterized transport system permease subunit
MFTRGWRKPVTASDLDIAALPSRARPVLAILLGVIAGALAAGVVLLWWRSPIPTFLLFTSILHGMLLGLCLMWLVARLHVHCPVRRTIIGVLAGVVSVAALLAGQYVFGALDHQRQRQVATRQLAPQLPVATSSSLVNALSEYDHDVLLPVTGHRGVLGQFHLMTRDAPWRGWMRGVEALLVIAIATGLCVRSKDARPSG